VGFILDEVSGIWSASASAELAGLKGPVASPMFAMTFGRR
jgi:hypothetical protein